MIGIHGGWGSGKSSVKNMALERLDELGEEAPRVIHFNPWMVSGEQHVAEAFFQEVELVLAEENLGLDAKKRASAWRSYARHFETAAKLSTALDVALPFIGALPGIGSSMAKKLRETSGLAEHAATSIDPKQKSFDAQRKEVREYFKRLKRMLVVVIDDLDRLTDEEIRVMIRIVKATTDFPKTVFILLFQKSTVVKALNPICGGEGETFLQKIVQVELGLPSLPFNQIASFWEAGVKDILGEETFKQELPTEQLVNIWFAGLHQYFRNLRDATRFLNSFAFMTGGFRKGGVWEVNLVDLITVEALRLFDPDVYLLAARNKHLLTSYSSERQQQDLAELATALVQARKQDVVLESDFKDVLSRLFPVLQSVWSNMHYGGESASRWVSQRRVCTERFFDVYFRFALPSGQVSEAVIATILKHKADRPFIRQTIQSIEKEGKLFEVLDRLEAEESLLTDSSMAYTLALSDLCDFWPRTPERMLAGFPGSLYAHRAAYRFLRSVKEPYTKSSALVLLIRETHGLLIAAEWIVDSTKEEDRHEWPKIEKTTAQELRSEWVVRVRKAKDGESFPKISGISRLLRMWSEWGDPEEVKTWLQTQGPKSVTAILEAYVSSTTSQSMGSFHSKTTRWISWKSLEPYGPRDFWVRVLGGLRAATFGPSESGQIVTLLDESLHRWQIGKDDSDYHSFGDDFRS